MGLNSPRAQLYFEGGVMLVAGVLAYWRVGGNWLLFAALLLAPDISMLGYLLGPRIGASIYNLAHMALWPAALILLGWFGGQSLALAIGLIWLCHLGMDRVLGFGFKYPTKFQDTHLQRL
jgi:uncharacterized protein DUF4260